MRPTSRDQIRIAIICRLEVEATAIEAIFDERYSLPYRLQKKGRIIENSYTTGRIRSRHVVLSLMHEGIYDTITARGLKAQFPNIVVALLVGVGGGTPYASDNTEIILGDVIISDRIIIEGITIRQALSHSSLKVGVHESAINLRGQKNLLQKRTTEYLEDLGIRKEWKYPGVLRDALFDASYRHIHHSQELNTGAICSICNFDHGNNVCEAALLSDCQQIGCTGKLVRRRRLDTDSPGVSVHIGDVFSHRMMIRCASNRDKVIKAEGAIAFEELGADVLEILPCFIIKGVCDYADGHKDGIWQKYAAAAAASCTKAFLEVYPKFFEGGKFTKISKNRPWSDQLSYHITSAISSLFNKNANFNCAIRKESFFCWSEKCLSKHKGGFPRRL